MRKFRLLNSAFTVVILIVNVPITSADEECTFSQAGMLQEVRRVASAFPGAVIDNNLIRASWEVDGEVVETFSANGCHDYGKQARRITKETERRDVNDVKAVALELGRKFMAADDFDTLHQALMGSIEFVHDSEKSEYMVIDHRFGEILITHSFANGVDSIGVSWPEL